MATAALVVVACALLLVAARWIVAMFRVDEVARAAGVNGDTEADGALTEGGRPAPDAAKAALGHLRAMNRYAQRSEADRAELPLDSPVVLLQSINELRALSSAGNARAACLLGAYAGRCRSALNRAQRLGGNELLRANAIDSDKGPPEVADENVDYRLQRQQSVIACSRADFQPNEEPWHYLLRSALLGHKPAMDIIMRIDERYPGELGERVDTAAAAMRFSGSMMEALASNGDAGALVKAVWVYRGLAGMAGPYRIELRNVPTDAARSLLLLHVLAHIRGKLPLNEQIDFDRYQDLETERRALEKVLDEGDEAWARRTASQWAARLPARAYDPFDRDRNFDQEFVGHVPWWVRADMDCRR